MPDGIIREWLIVGPIPMTILIAAIIAVQFYPLDKKEYRKS